MLEKENARHFVEAGREALPDKRTIKEQIILLVIFAVIPLFYAYDWIKKGINTPAVFLAVVPIVSVLFMWIFIRKQEKEIYLFKLYNTGLSSLLFSLAFLIWTLMEPIDTGNSFLVYLVIGFYIVLAIVIYFIIICNIKKDRFNYELPKGLSKKTIRNGAIGGAVGAAVIAPLIRKFMLPNLNEYTESIVLTMLCLVVSILMLIGTANLLKAYYVKKYGFTDPYEKKQTSITKKTDEK